MHSLDVRPTLLSIITVRMSLLCLSQSDLRKELERRGVVVSPATVSMWVSGQRSIPGAALGELVDILAFYGPERTELLAKFATLPKISNAPNDA